MYLLNGPHLYLMVSNFGSVCSIGFLGSCKGDVGVAVVAQNDSLQISQIIKVCPVGQSSPLAEGI